MIIYFKIMNLSLKITEREYRHQSQRIKNIVQISYKKSEKKTSWDEEMKYPDKTEKITDVKLVLAITWLWTS